MTVTGIQVTLNNGTIRTYPMGRSFDFDGYGDLVIFNDEGNKIATRKRGTWEDVDTLYSE